jgi:hypothetical protein
LHRTASMIDQLPCRGLQRSFHAADSSDICL